MHLAIYGCMSLSIAIYGCIWLYMVTSGRVAAVATATQHDYTFNVRKTCAFCPQLAQGDGKRVEGVSRAQASVVAQKPPL